jgi:hypothetical protein
MARILILALARGARDGDGLSWAFPLPKNRVARRDVKQTTWAFSVLCAHFLFLLYVFVRGFSLLTFCFFLYFLYAFRFTSTVYKVFMSIILSNCCFFW